MEDIERVIFDHLEKKSVKSALLINGPWGSGKTHYVKENIIPQIETKFADNDPIVIYQSLYGVKSKEELKLNLYIEAIPAYKYMKKFKKPGLKFLISSILHIWNINLTSWLGNLSSSTILKKDKNYIFIFDDLERVDEKMGVKSVLGWLNNFVEHSGFKTVLIGDETKISEEENYFEIKEKLIGTTVKFEPPNNVLDQINESILSDAWGDTLIQTNEKLIKQLYLHGAKQNLRSYEFALGKLQYVLKSIESIKDDLNEEVVRKLIIYTMSVCFEYRKGKINEDNIEQLKQEDFSQILGINAMLQRELEEEEAEREESINEIINKYFSNLGYSLTFFEAVNSLIIEGQFNTEKLVRQVHNHLGEGLDEKQNIYNKLYNFRRIDDEAELIRVTTKAIEFCQNGDFSLGETLFISDVLMYLTHHDVLDEELDDLYERFETILNTNSENFKPIRNFGQNINDTDREYGDQFERLFNLSQEINERNIQREKDEKELALFELFTTNTENFLDTIWSTENNFRYKPIFSNWDPANTADTIYNFSSTQIQSFKNFISERYKEKPTLLDDERDFIIQLHQELRNRREDLDEDYDKMRLFSINELINAIQDMPN